MLRQEPRDGLLPRLGFPRLLQEGAGALRAGGGFVGLAARRPGLRLPGGEQGRGFRLLDLLSGPDGEHVPVVWDVAGL